VCVSSYQFVSGLTALLVQPDVGGPHQVYLLTPVLLTENHFHVDILCNTQYYALHG
jgi:hypothetical protein